MPYKSVPDEGPREGGRHHFHLGKSGTSFMERWYPRCINNKKNVKCEKGASGFPRRGNKISKGHKVEENDGQSQKT